MSSITVCDTTACRFVRHRGPCGSLLRLRDKSVRLVKAVKSKQKKIKTGASHLKPRAMFLCTYFWMWCVFFVIALSKVAMIVYLDVMFVPFFLCCFWLFWFHGLFQDDIKFSNLGKSVTINDTFDEGFKLRMGSNQNCASTWSKRLPYIFNRQPMVFGSSSTYLLYLNLVRIRLWKEVSLSTISLLTRVLMPTLVEATIVFFIFITPFVAKKCFHSLTWLQSKFHANGKSMQVVVPV